MDKLVTTTFSSGTVYFVGYLASNPSQPQVVSVPVADGLFTNTKNITAYRAFKFTAFTAPISSSVGTSCTRDQNPQAAITGK
ncbi:hypothetical protein BGZ83_008752, partial [Gryganskiella cystojenkinii]